MKAIQVLLLVVALTAISRSLNFLEWQLSWQEIGQSIAKNQPNELAHFWWRAELVAMGMAVHSHFLSRHIHSQSLGKWSNHSSSISGAITSCFLQASLRKITVESLWQGSNWWRSSRQQLRSAPPHYVHSSWHSRPSAEYWNSNE